MAWCFVPIKMLCTSPPLVLEPLSWIHMLKTHSIQSSANWRDPRGRCLFFQFSGLFRLGSILSFHAFLLSYLFPIFMFVFFHAVMLISKMWGQLSGVVVDGKSGSEALRCRAAMVVWCATNPPRHRFGRAKIRAHHKAYHKTTRCIPELVLYHHTNSAKFAGFLQAS